MKKILSLTLAVLMLVSAVPMVHAAGNWEGGTTVTYTANTSESWTVTVPAQLAPSGSGDVTASGTWGSNRKLVVTADDSVKLTNSINANDYKDLDVTFADINLVGDNTKAVSETKQVSVAAMPADALFGTWSGTFYYDVELVDVVNTVVFYDVAYDLAPGSTSNYEQMMIGSDGTIYVKLVNVANDTECNRAFGGYTANGQTLIWTPGDNIITISEDGYTFTVDYGDGSEVVTYQYNP